MPEPDLSQTRPVVPGAIITEHDFAQLYSNRAFRLDDIAMMLRVPRREVSEIAKRLQLTLRAGTLPAVTARPEAKLSGAAAPLFQAMFCAGVHEREIAQHFGVSTPAVLAEARRQMLERPKTGDRKSRRIHMSLTDFMLSRGLGEDRPQPYDAELRELWLAGIRLADIAEHLKVSKMDVLRRSIDLMLPERDDATTPLSLYLLREDARRTARHLEVAEMK